jgi:hypothetical protein
MMSNYDRKDDLVDFRQNIYDHLEGTSLGTIAFLPDPANPSRMMHVVEHLRFTLATAKELSQERMYITLLLMS